MRCVFKFFICHYIRLHISRPYIHAYVRTYIHMYVHTYIHTYVHTSLTFQFTHCKWFIRFSYTWLRYTLLVTVKTYGNPGWNTAVCCNCVWQRSVTWFSMPSEVLLIMLELFVKLEVPAFSPCRGRVRLPAPLTLLVTLPETWSACNVLQFIVHYNVYP
jgi:hypothetical protein